MNDRHSVEPGRHRIKYLDAIHRAFEIRSATRRARREI
jgi:hypothetical protein